VAFKRQDLLDVVLLTLCLLMQLLLKAANIALLVLLQDVEFAVLVRTGLHRLLQLLDLHVRIPIISQDVFFLNLECALGLDSSSLLISQLLVLLLKQLVRVRSLRVLLIDESVLPRQRLDILSKLSYFLCL